MAVEDSGRQEPLHGPAACQFHASLLRSDRLSDKATGTRLNERAQRLREPEHLSQGVKLDC